MPEPTCTVIQELAPELVRGRALDGAHAEHAATCEACGRVLAGARALARDLATLEAPEPSSDLVARTLARVRLAAANAQETPSTVVPLEPARPRRRTAAQLLEAWALPGPAPRVAAPPERVWLRISIQAAAAILIVFVCSLFTLEFYPAYVEALEERNVHECQDHLRVLETAIARFAKDHPETAANRDEPLQNLALRDALLKGGYAKEEDFLCPAVRGAKPGSLCYFLRLPDAKAKAVAWDRFGNHGGGTLNVVRSGGKPEHLDGSQLWSWVAEGR
jgi:hypothetical protein